MTPAANPGDTETVTVKVTAPASTLGTPNISGFQLGYNNGPVLTILGTGFDPNPLNDQIYLLPASYAGVTPTQAALAGFAPLTATSVSSDGKTITVNLPAGMTVAGVAIDVVTLVHSSVNIPGLGTRALVTLDIGEAQLFSQTGASGLHYTFIVDSGKNSVQIVDPSNIVNGAPVVIANINVGVDPVQVVVSKDGLIAYVTNQGDGTVSVIDVDGLRLLKTISIPNSHPNFIALGQPDTNGAYNIYVDDRYNGNVYIFSSSFANNTSKAPVQTMNFELPDEQTGEAGLAVASDGVSQYLYLADPGSEDQGGTDLPGASTISTVGPQIIIVQLTSGQLAITPKYVKELTIAAIPYGVTTYTYNLHDYVGVASRIGSYSVIDPVSQNVLSSVPTELQPFAPTASATTVQLNPSAVQQATFDTYNAQAVVYYQVGANVYGFALFHNTFENDGNPAHDPTYGAGGNIGIIGNPFGAKPFILAATAEIPSLSGTFPDDLAISPDGQYLYVSVTGINRVYIYSIARMLAVVDLLQKFDPNALGAPGRGVTNPVPLDIWAKRIIAAGSAGAFLTSIGTDTSILSLDQNSTAANQFSNDLTTLTTGLPAQTQLDTFDVPADPNLVPNYADPLLVGIDPVGTGSNPEGIASGPKLLPDLIADSASVLAATSTTGTASTAATTSRLSITYTIVGQLSYGDVLTVTFTSADGTLNFTRNLSNFAAGTYTEIFGLSQSLTEAIGQVTVTISVTVAGDDTVKTNNTVTTTPFPLGLSAAYGNDPATIGGANNNDPLTFGTFLSGIPLVDVFTVRLDPSVASLIADVRIVDLAPGVSNPLLGTLVKDFTVASGQTKFTFTYDVSTLANGEHWVLEEFGANGTAVAGAPNQTYTFHEIDVPTWLDPKTTNGGLVANTIVWNASDNAGSGAYEVQQFEYVVSPAVAQHIFPILPNFIPLFGGSPLYFNAGGVLKLDFDLNGGVVNGTLDYGPALFVNLFNIYQTYFHLDLESLPGFTPKNGSAAINTAQLDVLLENFIEKSPAAAKVTSALTSLLSKLTFGASSKFEPGVTNIGPTFGFTPYVFNSSLNLTQGAFNIGITISKSFTLEAPHILIPIGPTGIVLSVVGSFSITPNLTLQFASNAQPDGSLNLGGEFIPDIKLTATLKGGITLAALDAAGVPPLVEAGVNFNLEAKYILSTNSTQSVPFQVPFSITIFGSLIGGYGGGVELTAYQVDNILAPTSYIFLGQVSSTNPLTVSLHAISKPTRVRTIRSPRPTALGAPQGTNTYSNETLLNDSDVNDYSFSVVNPTTSDDVITVKLNAAAPNFTAYVVDASGNIYGQYTATDADDGLISLAGLAAGQYYLVVQDGPAAGVGYSLTFTTPTTPKAFLSTNLSTDKTEFVAGDPFTVTVTIENLGSVASAAGVAYLVWTDSDEDASPNDAPLVAGGINVPALAPGQTFTGHYTVLTPDTSHGALTLGLFADVGGTTPQSSTNSSFATLNVEADYPPDALQPNGTLLNATQLGGLTGVTITESNLTTSTPSSNEYFQFSLPTDGTAQDVITITRQGNGSFVGVSVLDVNGNLVLQTGQDPSADAGTGVEQISLNGVPAGVYYIQVNSVDGTPFPYSLTVNSVGAHRRWFGRAGSR